MNCGATQLRYFLRDRISVKIWSCANLEKRPRLFILNIFVETSLTYFYSCKKGKSSPYSITERRVPELIPVLGSQPAGDVSHKPGDRLPLLSARPAVTPAALKRAATSFAAW